MGMPSNPGPVVQRAILTSELQRLRAENGANQSDVAAALDWSLSKLIRIEGGTVGISTTDLHALLRYYGLSEDDPAVGRLTSLAREGRKRAWWSLYRNDLSDEYLDFIGFEAGASTIRHFSPLLLPGLLQTEEYANAFTIELVGSIAERDVLVEVRMQRQEQVLERPDPPEFLAVLDEAALRRQVGGQTDASIMPKQLRHLITMLERPNVTIEIIPFSQGAHFGMMGDFIILAFGDQRLGDVLFLENARSSDITATDRASLVTDYRAAFENLRNLSLPADRTVPFLQEIIDSME